MDNANHTEESPLILSLCPGLRGLERGVERALGVPLRVAAYLEIEAFILENLPTSIEAGVVAPALIWADLKTFPYHLFAGKVHGLLAGYPCTPFSLAGHRRGKDDPRHLWPFIKNGIRAAKPVWVFCENVDDHLTMGFDTVYQDLHELGYLVETGIYSAEEAGAPHERQRLYIFAIRQEMAYTDGYDPGRIIDNVLRTKRESASEEDKRQRDRYEPGARGEVVANAGGIGVHEGGGVEQSEQPESDGLQGRDEELEGLSFALDTIAKRDSSTILGESRENGQGIKLQPKVKVMGDTESIGREGYPFVGRNLIEKDGEVQWCWPVRADTAFAGWPAGQGDYQFPYEPPRIIESSMEYFINGYNVIGDLHRAIGNSVVEQTAEIAFIDLIHKHIKTANYKK